MNGDRLRKIGDYVDGLYWRIIAEVDNSKTWTEKEKEYILVMLARDLTGATMGRILDEIEWERN